MNVLMIEVPTFERDGSVPFGVLYASSSALRNGHNVRILDLVKNHEANLDKEIKEFSPDVIGMGGITSSYGNCKNLIKEIRKNRKDIPVIVGGVISSARDLLLKKAGADFIVHGEGEITFNNLLNTLKNGWDPAQVKGISFIKRKEIISTDPQPQITSLDDISMPEYSLLDMRKYLDPIDNWLNFYLKDDPAKLKEIKSILNSEYKYLFPIITARGCTHKCLFCYRHMRGIRQHSTDYVIQMMTFLRDNYGVGLFQINDELTTGRRDWVIDFCNKIISRKMGISFIILSARVDNVDEEVL